MRKISAIHPTDPPQPTGPLAIRCPICDAAPGQQCAQPADEPFPDGSMGHDYRLTVAQEAELTRLLHNSHQAARNEMDTIIRRVRPSDLTTNEVIAFIGVLRPAYERVTREAQRRTGKTLRLVGPGPEGDR